MIARKSEHTTYIGVLLFSASPKFGWTPLGGGVFGVFDNCSGVNPVKVKDMINIWSNIHTTPSTDVGCEESEGRHFFLLRGGGKDRVGIEDKDARKLNTYIMV